MRRPALLWLAIAMAWGCEEPETEDLVLRIEGPDECTEALLGEVKAISIEVWGAGANGMCVLGRRCLGDVSLDPVTTPDLIEERISEVNQPLVDVGLEDARQVAIVLRTQPFQCVEGAAQACALTDLADAEDGTLSLNLNCGDCQTFAPKLELCP